MNFLKKEDILTLSPWVQSLKEFIKSRESCSTTYTTDTMQGVIELLTIYEQYRKYIDSNSVEFSKLVQLVDILKNQHIDVNFYKPWLCYFISCGIDEWSALWKDVHIIYERNRLLMNFIFEPNRIFYQEGNKLLAEITFLETQKGVFCINHTFVDSSLRGQGVASKLVEMAIQEIKNQNGKVTATCSYAQKWLERYNQ